MAFRVVGLPSSLFRPLYGLSKEELAQRGVEVHIANESPGFPCRVSLRDVPVGSRMLLLNFEHQPANTPYRSTHAIYVRKLADRAFEAIDTVPEVMSSRLVAVRAFDARHMMIDADVSEGDATRALIERLLENPEASYLQAHYARRGCYAARIERA